MFSFIKEITDSKTFQTYTTFEYAIAFTMVIDLELDNVHGITSKMTPSIALVCH